MGEEEASLKVILLAASVRKNQPKHNFPAFLLDTITNSIDFYTDTAKKEAFLKLALKVYLAS